MSRISAFNKGSLTSHQKLGTRLLGSALFFVIGSRQLMLATVSPFIHVSMKRNNVPTIRVYPPRRHDYSEDNH